MTTFIQHSIPEDLYEAAILDLMFNDFAFDLTDNEFKVRL
jgi:hypothetical protein